MDGAKNCGTYAVRIPSEDERLRTLAKRTRNIRNQGGVAAQPDTLQPHSPALGTDNFHGPLRNRGRHDHFLETDRPVAAAALVLQPLAQDGEADPVTGGKFLSGQLGLVELGQQSSALL